jgi:competence protein ComFC
MAIVKINPVKIEGRWHSGVALDLHTTSSTPIGNNEFGHMQFDTVRPEIAELLFRLKNRADREAAGPIIETIANFLAPYRDRFDTIVRCRRRTSAPSSLSSSWPKESEKR